jgi:lipopolysaccharide export system protein LptA
MRPGRNEAFFAAAFVAALFCGFFAPNVLAERTDRDKPVNIESDRMVADDAKKTATFDGKVVLTRGTLTIRADRIIVRQDNDGFQYGVAIGKPAAFRQKREGSDEYIDGEALRIEYDGRAERVVFFNNARLHRDGGDDVRGNFISYSSATERFTVQANSDAPEGSRDGRVRAVIMPKNKEPAAATTPLRDEPAAAVVNPRQK